MLTYEEELSLSEKLESRLSAKNKYPKNTPVDEMSEADQSIVEAGNEAAREIVEAYQPFIASLAFQIYRGRDLVRTKTIEVEDLIQTGSVAALVCTNKFSCSKGRRFNTYAGPHIKKSILASVDKSSTPLYASIDTIQQSNKWYAIREELKARLGREPNEAEMSEAFPDADMNAIADIPKRGYMMDIDSPTVQEIADETEIFSKFDLDYHSNRFTQALAETGVNQDFINAVIIYFGCDRGYPRDVVEFAETTGYGPRISKDIIEDIQNYMIHPKNRVKMYRYLSDPKNA